MVILIHDCSWKEGFVLVLPCVVAMFNVVRGPPRYYTLQRRHVSTWYNCRVLSSLITTS
jgi:hypothetical protein